MSWIVDSWRDTSLYDRLYEYREEYTVSPYTDRLQVQYPGPKWGRSSSNEIILIDQTSLYIGSTLKVSNIGDGGAGRACSDPIYYKGNIFVGYVSSGVPTIGKFDPSSGSETVVYTGTSSGTTGDQECSVYVSDTTAYFGLSHRFDSGGDRWAYWSVHEFDIANESGTEIYTSTEEGTSGSYGVSTFSVGLDSSSVYIAYSDYGEPSNTYVVRTNGKIDRTTHAFSNISTPSGQEIVCYGYKGYSIGKGHAGTGYSSVFNPDQTKQWEITYDYTDHFPQMYIFDESSYPLYVLLCESEGKHRVVALNSDESITTIKQLFSTSTDIWRRNGTLSDKILPWYSEARDFVWANQGFILPKWECL